MNSDLKTRTTTSYIVQSTDGKRVLLEQCCNKSSRTNYFLQDGIANPDNVAMVEEHNGLLIGEDTRYHENDVVWYMDLTTEKRSRIFSAPYGSEVSGIYWHSNINGWSYMMVVVQHPYGESDEEKRGDKDATGLRGWIGYIGPFKHLLADSDSNA